MPIELGHKALTKAHHFAIAFVFGVEIRPAFGAADRHARQSVFECLFKSEEFDSAEGYRRVKAQATFIGAKGAVESDSEAAIDLHFATVILPRYTKDNLSFRLTDALDNFLLGVFRVFVEHGSQRV